MALETVTVTVTVRAPVYKETFRCQADLATGLLEHPVQNQAQTKVSRQHL